MGSLKREILAGKYGLDFPLPSIQALVRRLGVSSITVRRAFDVLEREGLVVRARGRGTFVSRRGALRKIGLIVPGIAYSELFLPIVSEISHLAQKESYTLLFGDISSKSPEQRARAATRLARDFVSQGVAGVLYQDVDAVRRYVRKFKPQAVVCGNDMAAVELKQTLGKLGLKVPDDVRLMGFDDVKCASIVTPGLTSVHQPCAQIAHTAFYCLLDRIENPAMPTKTISLPVKLVLRESTMPQ